MPQQGTNVYNKLINGDKVAIIIGPTLSNTAKITNPIAQQIGVPVLGVSNTAGGITEIGDFIFRDSLTEAVVIPNTIKIAKEKLGLKKVVLFYGNDDAFTKSGDDVFRKVLQAEGIQILSEQTFAKGDRDFSPQLTQIKSQNPDAIICSALVEEASGIVSQARQLGIPKTVRIIGGNGFNSPALIKNAGDAAEGVIVGAAWNISSTNPLNVKFVDDYTKKYNHPPDQFAAQAFAGVHIAYQAAKSGRHRRQPQGHPGRACCKIKGMDTLLGQVLLSPRAGTRTTRRGPGSQGRQVRGVRSKLNRSTGVNLLAQQLVNGLFIGSVYGLFAVGYTLVFGVLDILNLAHAAVFTLGGLSAVWLVQAAGLSIWLAFPLATLLAGLLGLLLNRWPSLRCASGPTASFSGLISSIAMAIIFESRRPGPVRGALGALSRRERSRCTSGSVAGVTITSLQVGIVLWPPC